MLSGLISAEWCQILVPREPMLIQHTCMDDSTGTMKPIKGMQNLFCNLSSNMYRELFIRKALLQIENALPHEL